MISFQVFYNDEIKTINYNNNETILSLKKHIINVFKLECEYIDLDFKNETTIRGMGKFNLDRGIILRTFDNYKLERWNLDEKDIQCKLIEVDNYEPEKVMPIIKKANPSIYRPPSKSLEIKSGDDYVKPAMYSLDSETDFPTLSYFIFKNFILVTIFTLRIIATTVRIIAFTVKAVIRIVAFLLMTSLGTFWFNMTTYIMRMIKIIY